MRVKIISFFALFLFFLPFTQALTINIGFPLKISELFLFCVLGIYMFKGSVPLFSVNVLAKHKLLIFFVLWASMSFVINMFWNYDYPLKQIPFRINQTGDSFLRFVYIVVNILAFFFSVVFLKDHLSFLKYWVIGATVAGAYAWYLFISSGLGMPYVKLFGMDEEPQVIHGFIRCGTFKEGNYFGLFLLLSSIIALYINKRKSALFLILTVLTTFSTITIISTMIFIVYIFRKTIFKKKFFYIILISAPLLVMGVVLLFQTEYFETYVLSKINKPSNRLDNNNFSKVDRTLTARIAYFQGMDNPIFGVGPANYGLHYDKYNDFETFILDNSEWSFSFFPRKNEKVIPNNVYMEVFAEYGLIGFFIFVTFLLKILIISMKNKDDLITGGIIAILISFNAFPSFIMLFIWVFLAIPVAIYYKRNLYLYGF